MELGVLLAILRCACVSEIFNHWVTCVRYNILLGLYWCSGKPSDLLLCFILCSLGADGLRQWWLASSGGGISFLCDVFSPVLLGAIPRMALLDLFLFYHPLSHIAKLTNTYHLATQSWKYMIINATHMSVYVMYQEQAVCYAKSKWGFVKSLNYLTGWVLFH